MSETKQIAKEGYVVITPTVCQGDVLAWNTEVIDQMYPIVFDNYEDAWKEIAEDMIAILRQFIKGERELEHTDFGTDEYVAKYYEYTDV